MKNLTLRENVDLIIESINTNKIENLSSEELIKFNAILCNNDIGMYLTNNYVQICETVRFHLLRTMAESFEKRSKKAEFWVKVLAIMSLVASIAQVAVPLLMPPPPIEVKLPVQISQSLPPSLCLLQACYQATMKFF